MRLHTPTRRLLAVLWTLASSGALALPVVESRFDHDSEGWLALNGVISQGWLATGGNPGGHYEATDIGGGQVWVFQAPAAFTGDLGWAFGGTLSFDLKVATVDHPMAHDWGDVKLIAGSGLTIVTDAGPSPGLSWSTYQVTLAGPNWRLDNMAGPLASQADIAAVLSDVRFLRLRGEFSAVFDRGSLDNVVLAAAIPEPASWLLMLAGVLGLGWSVRRGRASPAASAAVSGAPVLAQEELQQV